MTGDQKQNFIRKKSREHVPEENERIMWSVHAIKKLRIEGFRKAEIEKCLKECIIIEDYPVQNRPLPDCLVLGFVGTDPVHVVTALDKDFDRVFIVTVYRPTPERWEDGWKKRKR
jgi:Domain of unknown function (DUF4258)